MFSSPGICRCKKTIPWNFETKNNSPTNYCFYTNQFYTFGCVDSFTKATIILFTHSDNIYFVRINIPRVFLSILTPVIFPDFKDGLSLLHPDVHRQGSGHRIAGPVATAARELEGCIPRGGHDPTVGQKDSAATDRASRRSLAASGTGGRLLLSRIDLEVILHLFGSSVHSSVLCARVSGTCGLK